jgi:hypothetical protein
MSSLDKTVITELSLHKPKEFEACFPTIPFKTSAPNQELEVESCITVLDRRGSKGGHLH